MFDSLTYVANLTSRLLKKAVHPSTKLRTNGGGIEIIGEFPFVLRLSKHENLFSSTSLEKSGGRRIAMLSLRSKPTQWLTLSFLEVDNPIVRAGNEITDGKADDKTIG
jgi:hypothetical protein